jgi:transaldolase/glucose-6-phosphate isomerase
MATAEKLELRTRDMIALGQSPWLDYLKRDLVESGALAAMAAEGRITGVTSNPTIFEKAITASDLYAGQIAALAARGLTDPYAAFVEIAAIDIRGACDALAPVYEGTRGRDGFVSLEVPPGIEDDTARTVAEAKRLFGVIGRPNLMIKVPGTPAAEAAIEELIAAGVNVNVTLLFALSAYERAANAYVRGLERRLAAGLDVSKVAGVASFFVSRVDTAVDALLPETSSLRGAAAVANARAAYARFRGIFSGPRWERLASAGAAVQRPLWASTGTKNPAYSDVLYVDSLVAPDTVNTMPEATLNAVLDHALLRPMTPAEIESGADVLQAVAAAGIDFDAVTDRLLVEGLASFQADFDRLLARLGDSLRTANRAHASNALGPIAAAVEARLQKLEDAHIVERIWQRDHTVWQDGPTECADRLGWLSIAKDMAVEAEELQEWARGIAAEGYRHAVLLGMGGSSLAPEVLRSVFGAAAGMLELIVLDTTSPAGIRRVLDTIHLERTLFLVSSKSGGTIETRSQFEFFWERLPRGDSYVVITDAGSALEKLAHERGVRRIFLNNPEIGGRYSALSYFGLVPAALIGVDVPALLGHARAAAADADPWLGAVLGEAALSGRDKLTFALPDALASLGPWLEQLVAESTGKHGRGILPVEGEPLASPGAYGQDRLFVAIGGHPHLDALEGAGHPVVRLPFTGPLQVGHEFFRWEFAVAVASHVLGINAFDQPNVQEAKDNTDRALRGAVRPATTLPLDELLAGLQPGSYLALTAYLDRSASNSASLAAARLALRDRFRVATTVGFGPRYLHSTGQLHKGGSATGLFVQVVGEDAEDLAIPGSPYTFGQLFSAQANGDLASLQAHGRPVGRVTLEELLAIALG